jgi:hypothetical protein
MRSIWRLLFGGLAVLGPVGSAMAVKKSRRRRSRLVRCRVRRTGANGCRRTTAQEKVRQLSKDHNDRIQKILDTAPPTLTYEAFSAQVHAISQENHDAVNAILTPYQLELMKAMVSRLDNGKEDRRAPSGLLKSGASNLRAKAGTDKAYATDRRETHVTDIEMGAEEQMCREALDRIA